MMGDGTSWEEIEWLECIVLCDSIDFGEEAVGERIATVCLH